MKTIQIKKYPKLLEISEFRQVIRISLVLSMLNHNIKKIVFSNHYQNCSVGTALETDKHIPTRFITDQKHTLIA